MGVPDMIVLSQYGNTKSIIFIFSFESEDDMMRIKYVLDEN